MAALPSHHRHLAQEAAAEVKPANGMVHKGSSLLEEIHDFQRELCEDPRHQDLPVCVRLMAAADNGAAKEVKPAKGIVHEGSSLLDEIHVMDRDQKEFCEDPRRKDRPDCARFLAWVAGHKRAEHKAFQLARSASKAALRENITREMEERTSALDSKLAELASKRKAWEAQLVEKYDLQHDQSHEGIADSRVPPAQVGGLRGSKRAPLARDDRHELHWPAVTTWSAGGNLRGKAASNSHAIVERREVRSARWAGMIPKVACITPVQSGPALKIQLKYFIDNFHLQSYEGPTQLVFVYHHTDHEAARLVADYADGFHIKGVAARGGGEFPSTAALRFGAWSSNADVIAYYNVQEFQHPQRLSLQVRALAYSSRPACIMRGLPNQGAVADDSTLLGEASWMKEHWHPLLKEQQDVLQVAEARHVVELDMGLSGHQHQDHDSLASLRSSMDESFDHVVALLKEV